MLKELFTNNKDIVINSDIDGFLCGMILQKYFDCHVVGFSDSYDKVWLSPEITNIDSPIYIDIYVARPNVVCIDQHIIAFNREHYNQIVSYGTKINPNLDRKRTFLGDMDSDYYHKYPFGTVHYLIRLMSEEGIMVELPDLYHQYNVQLPYGNNNEMSTCAGQVILRADDALSTTLSRYKDNALDWWAWLDPEHKYMPIEELRSYIDSCDPGQCYKYKDRIGSFFIGLGCDGIDGNFKQITDGDGVILKKVLYYRDVITSITGIELSLPERYVIHKGNYDLLQLSYNSDINILMNPHLYSYAFIFGPNGYKKNFSYTMNME